MQLIEEQIQGLSEESQQELLRKTSEAVGVRIGRSAVRVMSRERLLERPNRPKQEPKVYAANTSPESREAKRRRRQMEKRNVG